MFHSTRAFRATCEGFDSEGKILPNDDFRTKRVRRITDQLMAAVRNSTDMPDGTEALDFEVVVVNDSEMNGAQIIEQCLLHCTSLVWLDMATFRLLS